MDVGNPSNLERLRVLYPEAARLRADVSAESVSDDEIRAEIRTSERTWGQILCPHTATAAVVRKRLFSEFKAGADTWPWVLVATAHFREIRIHRRASDRPPGRNPALVGGDSFEARQVRGDRAHPRGFQKGKGYQKVRGTVFKRRPGEGAPGTFPSRVGSSTAHSDESPASPEH